MWPELATLIIEFGIFDEATKKAHLLMQVWFEVEAVLLCEPQLAVVVIETLLTDSQHAGSLLQVHLLATVGLGAVQVQSPPSLYQVNGLCY